MYAKVSKFFFIWLYGTVDGMIMVITLKYRLSDSFDTFIVYDAQSSRHVPSDYV